MKCQREMYNELPKLYDIIIVHAFAREKMQKYWGYNMLKSPQINEFRAPFHLIFPFLATNIFPFC